MINLSKVLISSILLAGFASSAFAQVNTNTTVQEGKVNTNATRQKGADNDNVTVQRGDDNLNATRQRGGINTNATAQKCKENDRNKDCINENATDQAGRKR